MRLRLHIPAMQLALMLLALALPGCMCVGSRSICRAWADWNTYGECSASVERLEHLPYRRPYVEVLRWQYGAEPVRPAPAPQRIEVAHGACATSTNAGRCEIELGPHTELDAGPAALPAPPAPASGADPKVGAPPSELLPPPPPAEPVKPLFAPPGGSFPEPSAKAQTIRMASGQAPANAERAPRRPNGAWLFVPPR